MHTSKEACTKLRPDWSQTTSRVPDGQRRSNLDQPRARTHTSLVCTGRHHLAWWYTCRNESCCFSLPCTQARTHAKMRTHRRQILSDRRLAHYACPQIPTPEQIGEARGISETATVVGQGLDRAPIHWGESDAHRARDGSITYTARALHHHLRSIPETRGNKAIGRHTICKRLRADTRDVPEQTTIHHGILGAFYPQTA